MELYIKNYNYNENWEILLDNLIDDIIRVKMVNANNFIDKIKNIINKTREVFYIIFITNLDITLMVRKIMLKLLNKFDDIKLKLSIMH